MLKNCKKCGTTYDIPCTPEQVKRWQGGELIQNVMPHLNADLRELMISGICGSCFDKMFPDEDE